MKQTPLIPACPAFPFADPLSSHLLQDPLTGEWVIIAPGRRYRPDGHGVGKSKDPFSPSGLTHQKVLAAYGTKGFPVIAIENSYPVFHEDRELVGSQEILVEGAKIQSFSLFTVQQIRAVIDGMAERNRVMRGDPKIRYIVTFKNDGPSGGASQPHPHSQIFGLHFVPARIRHIAAQRHLAVKKHRLGAHALAMREATPARTVFADAHAVAYADPTSRYQYGVRISLRRNVDNITKTRSAERLSLARAIHALLPFVRSKGYAYNFFFHDVVGESDECFEIRFSPRVNIWGGFELDSGIVVNPVPAECAAEEYRAAKK